MYGKTRFAKNLEICSTWKRPWMGSSCAEFHSIRVLYSGLRDEKPMYLFDPIFKVKVMRGRCWAEFDTWRQAAKSNIQDATVVDDGIFGGAFSGFWKLLACDNSILVAWDGQGRNNGPNSISTHHSYAECSFAVSRNIRSLSTRHAECYSKGNITMAGMSPSCC